MNILKLKKMSIFKKKLDSQWFPSCKRSFMSIMELLYLRKKY